MAVQDLETVACAGIPEANSLIITAAGQNTPVGTEGHRSDETGMATQHFEALTRIGVPEADGLVFAAASQNATIRTESHRSYPVLVSRTGKEWCNSVCIP